MAGVTVSGVLWAIFQNNAGGAWDNAKKSFEAGVEINGEMTYKGSDAHKAAVTGDTVGDPFKDTSGPSMNILIKLTCLIGLVIAPILGGHTDGNHAAVISQEVQTEMVQNNVTISNDMDIQKTIDAETGIVTANVSYKKAVNGATITKTKKFVGTESQVEAKIKTFSLEEVINFK